MPNAHPFGGFVFFPTVLFVVLLCCLVFTTMTFGQTETATLTGTVTDASGAVVPDAEVLVKNADTNVATTTTTNHAGVYLVPSLRPGRYLVVVSKSGFKRVSLTDLVLSVQEVASY